jgi:RNA polymerase sigma-70 factor (ECF subfamily)
MPVTASRTSPTLTLVHDRDRDEVNEQAELSGEIAIEDLYTRFAPYVAAIASRILGREGEVQDVVQDVFTAAVRGLRDRSDPHQVRGWLAKVAVRTSMRKLRARSFWKFFDLDDAPSYGALADPSAGPHEKQLISEVYRVLDTVGVKDRVAWVLRHVEGESLERVATLCDCSLATAKRRIKRAHDSVKIHLDGEPLSRFEPGGVYVD